MSHRLTRSETRRMREWEEGKAELEYMIGTEHFFEYTRWLVQHGRDQTLYKVALHCKNRYQETGEQRFRDAFYLAKQRWESSDTLGRPFEIELE